MAMSAEGTEPKKVGRPKKEKTNVKFSYTVVELHKDLSLSDRGAILNSIGTAGGELVAVIPKYDGTHVCYIMAETK